MKKIFSLVFMILGIVQLSPNLYCEDFIDTEGKDFWVTFMPNYHQEDYYSANNDSLFVFIAASKPTKGKIEYKNMYNKSYVHNFVITDISKIYSFGVHYEDFELLGVNDGGSIDTYDAQTARVAKQSFHITSDDDITVYAYTEALKTSEACIVLPTEVLGKDYIMLSYNSDVKSAFYGGIESQSTPSQFAVVATENNTTVKITPSAYVFVNSNQEHQVTLNKGESYLVQADLNYALLDLTGSLISADKPIAVFSGHQRATIPIEEVTSSSSRDCLFEQMLPTKNWGRNAFIIPFEQSANTEKLGNDIYRILSSTDDNKIFIDGVNVATLAKGEFYQAKISTAKYVQADAPILVAQYKQTSLFSKTSYFTMDSDPLMVLIPPKEQFVDSCRVLNMQSHDEYYDEVYTEQYISIVTPNIAGINVSMDNVAINSNKFTPIGNSGYSYANLAVSDGAHLLKSPFGLMAFVYGYGAAVSYGYLGGMSFKSFDFNAPNVTSTTSCYTIEGFVTDTLDQDKGILTVGANNTENNVKVDIDNVKLGVRHFKGSLIDKFKDGSFTLTATDSAGLQTVKTYNIPGFTLAAVKSGSGLYTVDDFVLLDSMFCYDMKVYNYGKYNQDFSGLALKGNNSDITVTYPNHPVIAPGDSIDVQICFKSQQYGTFSDVIVLKTPCGDRDVIAVNFVILQDTNNPSVATINDPCNKYAEIIIREDALGDAGLKEVVVVSSTNCNVVTNMGNPRYARIKVTVSDPYQDASYEIKAVDKTGKDTVFTGFLPGFTLSFGYMNSDTVDFGKRALGEIYIDTLMIRNTGNREITINDISLAYNTLFSIAQSQLPLIIPAYDSVALEVYYLPVLAHDSLDHDYLSLSYNCMPKTFPLVGDPEKYNYLIGSKCDFGVELIISSVNRNFVKAGVSPNPAGNKAKIAFFNSSEGNVSIRLINSIGSNTAELFSGTLGMGSFEIETDLSLVPQGVYVLQIITQAKVETLNLVITK